MNILIFSKPIHSGKTTALMSWSKQQNCGGVLMPNVSGNKLFFDIGNKQYFESSALHTNEIQIGKYKFSTSAFIQANDIIIKASTQSIDYLIIDEVGLLELRKEGFYDAVNYLLTKKSSHNFKGNIVLVVRDSLLKDVVDFFNINTYKLFCL